MISEFTATPLFSAWPFWVLEIDPTADNRSIERAYQKIANSMQLKIPKAAEFITPLGLRLRDEFVLREARAILTNPELRAVAEFWYLVPQSPQEHAEHAAQTQLGASEGNVINWQSVLRTA